MRIIPAIDIIDGKCVRLSKGSYETKKVYSGNPVAVAQSFQDHGIGYLHLVDLDGARTGRLVNHKILEEIASKTSLQVDFGGGIKTSEDIETAFSCGARQVTGGSVAVSNPGLFEQWITAYGSEKIILGADFRSTAEGERIAVSGWQRQSTQDLIPFIEGYRAKGIEYVICTDIAKDGMLSGPGTKFYEKVIDNIKEIKLIASGGITTLDDLMILRDIGCEGAIIGKAIYEGRVSLSELSNFILSC